MPVLKNLYEQIKSLVLGYIIVTMSVGCHCDCNYSTQIHIVIVREEVNLFILVLLRYKKLISM